LSAIHEAVDEDGPFVVGMQSRVGEALKVVQTSYRRMLEGVDPPAAVELAAAIEQLEFDSLFGEVRQLARSAVRKLTDRLYDGAPTEPKRRRRLARVASALGEPGQGT
jgi:hypothetical protein